AHGYSQLPSSAPASHSSMAPSSTSRFRHYSPVFTPPSWTCSGSSNPTGSCSPLSSSLAARSAIFSDAASSSSSASSSLRSAQPPADSPLPLLNSSPHVLFRESAPRLL